MNRKFKLAFLFALCLMFLLVGQTAARAVVTDFTGTATTFTIDWGEWIYGEHYIYINDLTHSDAISATDPRLDGGVNHIVVHARLDYEGNGRMWGTWTHVNGDGIYEGTYRGTVINFWEDDFIAIGTGVGYGEYEGQIIRLTNEFTNLSGTIVEP